MLYFQLAAGSVQVFSFRRSYASVSLFKCFRFAVQILPFLCSNFSVPVFKCFRFAVHLLPKYAIMTAVMYMVCWGNVFEHISV